MIMPEANWHWASTGKQTWGLLPTNNEVEMSFEMINIGFNEHRIPWEVVLLNQFQVGFGFSSK